MSDTRTTESRSLLVTQEGDLLVANEDGIHCTRVKRADLERAMAKDQQWVMMKAAQAELVRMREDPNIERVRVGVYHRFSKIRHELQRCIHDPNPEFAAEALRADDLAREGMFVCGSPERLDAALKADMEKRAELERKLEEAERKLEEAEAAMTNSKVREVVDDQARLRAALDATQAKLDGTDRSRAAAWRERDELSDQVSDLAGRLERVRALAVAALQPGEEPTDWHAALTEIDKTLRANEAETTSRSEHDVGWPLRQAKIRQTLRVIAAEWQSLSPNQLGYLVGQALAALDPESEDLAVRESTSVPLEQMLHQRVRTTQPMSDFTRAIGRSQRQGQQIDHVITYTSNPRVEIIAGVDVDAELAHLVKLSEADHLTDADQPALADCMRNIGMWVEGFARRRIDELGEELKLAPVRERERWAAAMRLAANRVEKGDEDGDIERSWLHATYGWAHRIDANDPRAQLDAIGVRRPIVFFGPLSVPPQVSEIRGLLDVLEEHSRMTLVVLQGLNLDWLDDCLDADYDDDDPGHALTLQYVHLYQKLLAGLQKIETGRIAITRGTGRALP